MRPSVCLLISVIDRLTVLPLIFIQAMRTFTNIRTLSPISVTTVPLCSLLFPSRRKAILQTCICFCSSKTRSCLEFYVFLRRHLSFRSSTMTNKHGPWAHCDVSHALLLQHHFTNVPKKSCLLARRPSFEVPSRLALSHPLPAQMSDIQPTVLTHCKGKDKSDAPKKITHVLAVFLRVSSLLLSATFSTVRYKPKVLRYSTEKDTY